MNAEKLAGIYERVSKILKLAEKAGTHQEKLHALAMAQDIMEKYGIEMAEIEAHSHASIIPEDCGIIQSFYKEHKSAPRWMEWLLVDLAAHFDCKPYKSSDGKYSTGKMMGRKTDLKMAVMFFDFITFEIKVRGNKLFSDSISRVSWQEGAVVGVKKQLSSVRKDARQNVSEAGLIILNTRIKAVEEAAEALRLRASSARTVQYRDSQAYTAGHKFGETMALPGSNLSSGNTNKRNTLS